MGNSAVFQFSFGLGISTGVSQVSAMFSQEPLSNYYALPELRRSELAPVLVLYEIGSLELRMHSN
jgi:hypothetical protein